MKVKCYLENIVENIDGSLTYYLKDDCRDYGHKIRTKNELIELAKKSNKGLKVEICQWREQRSLDANAYFHVLVDKISKVVGRGAEEIKREMNLDYGTIMRDEKGGKVGIKLPKSVNVNLIYPYAKWFDTRIENGIEFNCYIIYKPTHTLDTKEMAQLIDGVVQECKDLDIETKTPDQIAEMLSLWESYEKQKK
jgi:hypothetical protein